MILSLSLLSPSLSCKRCVVVGNGGILANRSLGPTIDEHDVVARSVDGAVG